MICEQSEFSNFVAVLKPDNSSPYPLAVPRAHITEGAKNPRAHSAEKHLPAHARLLRFSRDLGRTQCGIPALGGLNTIYLLGFFCVKFMSFVSFIREVGSVTTITCLVAGTKG